MLLGMLQATLRMLQAMLLLGSSSFSTIDINGGAIDGTPIGASSASTADTNITGSGTAALATVDINAGEIDGTNIGAGTPATGAFSTLSASGTATFTDVTATGTTTVTTADINGGAIDGTNIGASTPGTGVFSALTTTGDSVTIQTTEAQLAHLLRAPPVDCLGRKLYICRIATDTWKRVLIETWS